MTIDQSQVSGNTAEFGAGLYQAYYAAMARITSSSFSSNTASFQGGAIQNLSNMTILNSTIASNSAASGGGIYSYGVLLTIQDCTIVNSSGSDLYNQSTQESCVVGNTIFSRVYGDISSQGHNLIADSSQGLGFVASDLLNVNPMLGPLQNNGGPTLTETPLPGSPAIDAGSNALAVDPSTGLPLCRRQRGISFPRIVNFTVDIGATEVQGPWHFVVTVEPPGTVTAGSGFGLTVTAEDSSGHVDAAFNGTVSVALYNNPGQTTLGGTLTVTAKNGVATFSGLTIPKAATAYTLLVSGSGVTGATTTAFERDARPGHPTGGDHPAARQRRGRQSIRADRLGGGPIRQRGSHVQRQRHSRSVEQPRRQHARRHAHRDGLGGVTVFSGLTLNHAGIGYTLRASTSGLTAATTLAFNIYVPTIYTVDLTSASGAGSGNSGDLVYVIGLANADTNIAGSLIEFDPSVFNSASPHTITLSSTLVLSETAGPEVIDGPAPEL